MNREQRTATHCAIYTRKSCEEGLEQSFNSLDAQHEACEAFISSQRHEGWRAMSTRYDDGGYSGGSMERPALKRLLADVAANKINVIVVYKHTVQSGNPKLTGKDPLGPPIEGGASSRNIAMTHGWFEG